MLIRGSQRNLAAVSSDGRRRRWPVDWVSDICMSSLLNRLDIFLYFLNRKQENIKHRFFIIFNHNCFITVFTSHTCKKKTFRINSTNSTFQIVRKLKNTDSNLKNNFRQKCFARNNLTPWKPMRCIGGSHLQSCNVFSRPGQSQRLLYKHLCDSFIH